VSFTLKWKLDRRALVAAATHKEAQAGLSDAAEFILETSNRTVPIEEATLERSGMVDLDGLAATVSYDTPYAREQHENLDLTHDAGRRAKYLEKTMLEEKDAAIEMLRKRIGRVFK
jgi:hypothetical protein